MTNKTVCAVNWTEYERGCGQRPDGHTLHLTFEDAQNHIKEYWAGMPDEVLDEYSAPSVPKSVTVDGSVFQKLVNSKDGYIWGNVSKWA